MKSNQTVRILLVGLSVWFFLVSQSNGMEKNKNSTTVNDTLQLTSLGEKYGTDKQDSHRYLELYELFFKPIRQNVKKIFEIGVLDGASLRVWQDYFPKGKVYGVDIDNSSKHNTSRIKTFIADQSNREQLKVAMDAIGNDIDIIIDDGGHAMNMQQISFGFLFKYLKPGGLYIIEDLHTSLPAYYQGYGSEDGDNTTLNMVYNFINTSETESKYMTPEERELLKSSIEYCSIFYRTTTEHSITSVFQKKK